MEDELLITLSSEYEANQVMAEMQSTIKEMEESEYYRNMVQQLQNGMLRDNILRILGSDKDDMGGNCGDRGHKIQEEAGRLHMVIYGLGSIQFSYFSQYQLSLAILLRRDFSHWIKGIIEVYDPRGTTPVDAKVMKALGCKVLININEKFHKRVVDDRSPTLFFMPHVPVTVVKDLFLANWCPSRLNKMVLFTDSFHLAVGDLQKMNIRTIDDIIGLGDETLMKTNLHEHSTLGCDGGDGRVDDETMYLLKTNVEYTLLELDCDGRPCKPEEYCSEESVRRGVPCDVDVWKWPFAHLNWHFFNFFDDVHQLEALLLPVSRDFSHWIKQTIHSFDPCTSPIDAKVMKALGIEVEYVNEQFRRRVNERPTLFFMPNVAYLDLGNLLEVNWRTSDLNKIILFTNVYEALEENDLYAKTVLKHTIKFDCHYKYEGPLTFRRDWPLYNMTCHFFNLLPEAIPERPRMRRHQEENPEVLDEDKCLTNCFRLFSYSIVSTLPGNFEWYPHALEQEAESWLSSMIESRIPTWPGRFNWRPPYSDWTKLNFSAVVATTNYNLKQGSIERVIGYGGLFHNGKRECLLSYSGPSLDDLDELEDEFFGDTADLDFANAVALREGLRFFIQLPSNGRRLFIEGDSVSIVRWANRLVPPPKRLTKVFLEISSLLSRMEPVIFLILKQANSMAIELARERATKLLLSRKGNQ